MDKEQLKKFLKENLKVKTEINNGFLKIKILIDNETISESTEKIY